MTALDRFYHYEFALKYLFSQAVIGQLLYKLELMSVSTDNLKKATQLKLLPEFAQFVLDQHYDDFLSVSFQLMYELNAPLLSFFSEGVVRKLSNISNTELLLYLAQNNSSAHIQKAIDRWRSDQLRTLKRNEIVVDDITRVGHRAGYLQKDCSKQRCGYNGKWRAWAGINICSNITAVTPYPLSVNRMVPTECKSTKGKKYLTRPHNPEIH